MVSLAPAAATLTQPVPDTPPATARLAQAGEATPPNAAGEVWPAPRPTLSMPVDHWSGYFRGRTDVAGSYLTVLEGLCADLRHHATVADAAGQPAVAQRLRLTLGDLVSDVDRAVWGLEPPHPEEIEIAGETDTPSPTRLARYYRETLAHHRPKITQAIGWYDDAVEHLDRRIRTAEGAGDAAMAAALRAVRAEAYPRLPDDAFRRETAAPAPCGAPAAAPFAPPAPVPPPTRRSCATRTAARCPNPHARSTGPRSGAWPARPSRSGWVASGG